ncbi:hypothetical protein SGFS_065560 [Streptomyces graminofaciens]|uniref:Bacteriophage T5 Orf172 DNA-binding domain-containing protein n=1 Tax=Streptomyces graminofaciens TaxID=68212 RepID=A0ABN5VP62_9ACTN|nr:GIY-YIG nuclease family protein [Streptomyces graminofaciens]BBC35262.1 hypothetical protein SGFS_065560 [Streptomyces graminofaciens]
MNDLAFSIGEFDRETGYRPLNIPDGPHADVVYFVLNGNRVKIGTTANLRNRVRALSLPSSNVIAVVPGGRSREAELHAALSHLRVGRTEWFAFDPSVADLINHWHAQAMLARRHARFNVFTAPMPTGAQK